MRFIQLTEMGTGMKMAVRVEDISTLAEDTMFIDDAPRACVNIKHNDLGRIYVSEHIHEVLRLVNGGIQ